MRKGSPGHGLPLLLTQVQGEKMNGTSNYIDVGTWCVDLCRQEHLCRVPEEGYTTKYFFFPNFSLNELIWFQKLFYKIWSYEHWKHIATTYLANVCRVPKFLLCASLLGTWQTSNFVMCKFFAVCILFEHTAKCVFAVCLSFVCGSLLVAQGKKRSLLCARF